MKKQKIRASAIPTVIRKPFETVSAIFIFSSSSLLRSTAQWVRAAFLDLENSHIDQFVPFIDKFQSKYCLFDPIYSKILHFFPINVKENFRFALRVMKQGRVV